LRQQLRSHSVMGLIKCSARIKRGGGSVGLHPPESVYLYDAAQTGVFKACNGFGACHGKYLPYEKSILSQNSRSVDLLFC